MFIYRTIRNWTSNPFIVNDPETLPQSNLAMVQSWGELYNPLTIPGVNRQVYVYTYCKKKLIIYSDTWY